MGKSRLILDCDPGQDDAVNLLLAFAAKDRFDILGITTVAGNAPLALTQRNARLIADLAGVADIPIHAGCDRPMARDLITAAHVHGSTGLDGVDLWDPRTPLAAQHGVHFLVDALRAAPDASVTLVPTGPLTNIAMALALAPDIASKIAHIVLMGGAMREGGNITPSAEFNFYVDPHAAERVLQCGRPITVFGLDVTHQLLCTPERLARIAAIGGPVARAVHDWLGFFNRFDSAKYGSPGAPLHDPCTMAYLLAPQLFALKGCAIRIETVSPLTLGHSAVDFWGVTGAPANANWAYGVDGEGFFDLLLHHLERF
jgi:purine nucleosidase